MCHSRAARPVARAPVREPVRRAEKIQRALRHRIGVAGIAQEGGVKQRFGARPRAATGMGGSGQRAFRHIAGKSPAGVKRQPECGHRHAAQNRLKAQPARHGPHLGGGVQHRLRRQALRDDHNAMARRNFGQIAARFARPHVRMREDREASGVMRGEGPGNQPLKTGSIRASASDRGVAAHLINEHDLSRQRIGRAVSADIILGQALAAPARQPCCGGWRGPGRRLRNQPFKAAFARRVVINPDVVSDERDRRRAGFSKTDRTDKTVLQHGKRQALRLRAAARFKPRAARAPAEPRRHWRCRAKKARCGDDAPRAKKQRQMRQRQHACGGDTQNGLWRQAVYGVERHGRVRGIARGQGQGRRA